MRKQIMKLVCILVFSSFSLLSTAQNSTLSDSLLLLTINQQIDQYVVEKNTVELNNLYANDFVFSHGSGKVEGKEGWFSSVEKGNFLSRQHDSVRVELHQTTAIVRGKLMVQKRNKDKTDHYFLYYVRVYSLRNKQWLLISHITTAEFHTTN